MGAERLCKVNGKEEEGGAAETKLAWPLVTDPLPLWLGFTSHKCGEAKRLI